MDGAIEAVERHGRAFHMHEPTDAFCNLVSGVDALATEDTLGTENSSHGVSQQALARRLNLRVVLVAPLASVSR